MLLLLVSLPVFLLLHSGVSIAGNHQCTLISVERGSTDYGQHVPKVGPWGPSGGKLVEFGSLDDVREVLEADAAQIAAFMIEPIQGAAGYVSSQTSAQTGCLSAIAEI